jgi:hypothetical protein
VHADPAQPAPHRGAEAPGTGDKDPGSPRLHHPAARATPATFSRQQSAPECSSYQSNAAKANGGEAQYADTRELAQLTFIS